MRFLIAIALSAILVGACGTGLDTDADLPRFDVPEEANRAQFLRDFVLLDPEGREAPHFDASTGKAPFGALVYMPLKSSGKKGSYCTLSHLREGEVVTNAHCVEDDSDPANYFVVFYTRTGIKKAYRIGNFISVGDSDAQDYAVLRISNRAAREFDVMDPEVVDTTGIVQVRPAAVQRVSIWSYDPLYNHVADFNRYNQHAGMKAKRSDCNMSRTLGELTAVNNNTGGQYRIGLSQVNPQQHLVIDGCSQKLISGNSGSIITTQGSSARAFGVYHWAMGVGQDTLESYPCVSYTGNTGNSFTCPNVDEDEGMYRVFGVGTSLFEVL